MTLESDFKSDPMTFLKAGAGGHVIIVPEGTDGECTTPGRYRFYLEKGARNAVYLRAKTTLAGDYVNAYYLPWEMYKATTMDLGDEADFFFTSEMTNCRFTVWDSDPKRPKVAHVSGAIRRGNPSKARDEMEEAEGLDTVRGRRLSISGGQDRYSGWGKAKVLEQAKSHDYRGQAQRGGGPSSAFVFGQRGEDGKWAFSAQIVKDNMAEVRVIEDDLSVLGFVRV